MQLHLDLQMFGLYRKTPAFNGKQCCPRGVSRWRVFCALQLSSTNFVCFLARALCKLARNTFTNMVFFY